MSHENNETEEQSQTSEEGSQTPPEEETKSISVAEWNNLQAKMRKDAEARKALEAKAAEYEQQIKDSELSKLKKEDADKYAEALQKQADEKLSLAEQRLAEAEKTAQRSALQAAAQTQNVADIDLTMMALDQLLANDPTLISDYNDKTQVQKVVLDLLESKPLLKKPANQTLPPVGNPVSVDAGFDKQHFASLTHEQQVAELRAQL